MYRIKLRRTADGLGLVLNERDVARLCLAEGDELVVSEVLRTPAYQPEPTVLPESTPAGSEEDRGAETPAPPTETQATPPPPAPKPDPAARPDQTEIDKSAFRRLAR